jgi:hypothetical protein
MTLATNIAKHLREVFFGGNWTCSNMRDQLKEVTWQQAGKKVHSANTILTLFSHMSYYVALQLRVLRGGPVEGSDEESFRHGDLESQEQWELKKDQLWRDVEELAALVEKLPDNVFWEDFRDKKYGSYYRNLHGLIEHTHYHLGQIALLKKWL